MNDFICSICKEHCSSLKIHIKQHNITEQKYYDLYNKTNDNEGYCLVCNQPTHFQNIYKGYNKYCSRSCLNKSPIHTNSVKQTKLIRYGNEYYSNPNKRAETISHMSMEQKQEIVQKVKQTKKERYGDENYNNSSKYKETCQKIYGTNSPFENEKIKKQISDKYYAKSDEEKQLIIQKRKNTINSKSDEEKQIINQKHRDAYFNKSSEEQEQIKIKSNNTKRKNHSFKSSNLETDCYNILLTIYSDTIRSYHSTLYPYNCDFYIPSKDMYIECNFHWTHGYMKYDGRKSFCKNQLQHWKERAKISKYFANAIYTWTVRDIQKYKVAKQNNLNYKVFYTKQEFDDFIITLMQ